MSQQSGGRYERSMSGMIGAMLVSVAVIAGFVLFRSFVRDDLEVGREPVDYIPVVQAFHEGGTTDIAYPISLPAGWHAVGAGATRSGWSMDLQTDDDAYIGIRQEKRLLPDMLNSYVDPAPEEGDEVSVPGEFGPTWREFTDQGGDYALATSVGKDQVLLIFGSAPAEEIRVFASSLTKAPLD